MSYKCLTCDELIPVIPSKKRRIHAIEKHGVKLIKGERLSANYFALVGTKIPNGRKYGVMVMPKNPKYFRD